MKTEEVMTNEARCVPGNSNLVQAAATMRELDVGSLPVCSEDRLVGMLTDRDIALRVVAEGKDPRQTRADEIMSPGIHYGFVDQEVSEIAEIMEKNRIRRLPVLNREKRLVGIVSISDVARQCDASTTQELMKEVTLAGI